jgi:rubredoxin
MSLERERDCPVCGESRTFYRAASTELHLGTKVKWHCPGCEYGFVTIGEEIDTSASA